MTKWTEWQRRAITDAGDILVSAGAGSGKTAVLTERIVRLVREGEGVRSILCVTFTVAAANEMKKRISRALFASASDEGDPGRAQRLHAEARAAESASISTIHSFCTQVLRRHFSEAGLDPSFRVADVNEIALMREEVWDELCETRLTDPEGAFAALTEAIGGDKEAFAALGGLYDFCRAQAEPSGFLDAALEKYDVTEDELASSEEVRFLVARSARRLLAAALRLQSARDALAKENPNTAAFIDEELFHARAAAASTDPASLRAALEVKPHAQGRKISWKGVSPELKAPADAARDALKKVVADELSKVWRAGMGEECALIAAQRPLMAELFDAIRDFEARFAQEKRTRNVIDYGDMEHMTLALLRNGDIASEYRRRFRYVFMDEYQDCNAVQEEIIRAVASPGRLFLVGDVKQSIYRFRLAEPSLFIRRSAEYAAGRGGERIDLRENFRSSKGVLDAVNALFSRIMNESVAELSYDERAALVHAREEFDDGEKNGEKTGEKTGEKVEFIFCDMLSSPEEEQCDAKGSEEDCGEDRDPEDAQPRTLARTEAAIAARRIRALMESERIYDAAEGGMRKLRYSDMAVLLRSYKGVAEEWLETFSASGIPSYCETAGGYFDAVEVRVFIELLRVIDNRTLDIPMVAVLRSPIGGFSTEELIELRTSFGNIGEDDAFRCFDALTRAAKENIPLGVKAKGFLDKLARYGEAARLLSVESLIGLLTDETDYALFCRALPGGRQREANLDALCEKARVFEATGAGGLSAFLAYTDKLRSAGAEGAPQTAGANVVRIMSIHASKGLEFPVVLLGGLGKKFNMNITRDRLVAERDTGVAVRFNMGGVRTQSVYARAITARCLQKDLAEEMRVLYVAMTRAREHLVLICAHARGDALIARAAAGCSPEDVAEGTSFASWLLACILRAPEGAALKERYGVEIAVPDPPIHIRTSCEYGGAQEGAAGRMTEASYDRFRRLAVQETPDTAIFERKYAFAGDTGLASKVSVTGLAGHEIRMTEAPDFLLEERMSAADRGTAFHALMQRIRLAAHDAAGVAAETERLCGEGLLSRAQADAIDPKRVACFFASPLGKRLIASDRVRRELEFNIALSARTLGVAQTDERVILQGVIDCCFIENGAWVLLDYKTDAYEASITAREASRKHARQIGLYADALEKLTGTPVREKYIYLFAWGEAVEMTGVEA